MFACVESAQKSLTLRFSGGIELNTRSSVRFAWYNKINVVIIYTYNKTITKNQLWRNVVQGSVSRFTFDKRLCNKSWRMKKTNNKEVSSAFKFRLKKRNYILNETLVSNYEWNKAGKRNVAILNLADSACANQPIKCQNRKILICDKKIY